MFSGGFLQTAGKALVAIVLVIIMTGIAARMLTVDEIRAWSQTIRGVVNQAGTSSGGTSGANLPTGAR